MNENLKPSSRRRVIIGGLIIAAGILCFFVLLPCTLRKVISEAALGRDISMLRQVYMAARVYRLDRGHYPSSLDEADFQPYLHAQDIAFLREGRLTYHPPKPDSPPTFIMIHMTTPRGDFSSQLDGTLLYPNSQ